MGIVKEEYNPDPEILPIFFAVLVAIPTVLFGYELGMLFGNQAEFAEFFVEAANRTNVIIGTLVLGLVFGVFIAGYIAFGSGRKMAILSSSVLGTLAIVASNVAPNFTVLLCSYFVIGFALGMYMVPSLLYICEIVLPDNRAWGLMLVPFFFFIGTEISLFIPSLKSISSIITYAALVFINLTLVMVSLVKLPESPRFLALTGSTDAALSILFRLRRDMGVAARELAEINECCRGEAQGIELFLQHTVCRRMLTFLCMCIVLFNSSGATIVPYMLVDFLNYHLTCEEDNVCNFSVNSYVLALCFTTTLASLIWHAFALSNYSRRRLFIVETLAGAACLFFATFCYLFPASEWQQIFLLFSLLTFIFLFFGSFIAFVCVVCVELLPVRGREFGMAAIGMSCGIGCLFGLQLFKPVFNMLTIYGFFLSCSLLATFLCYLIYALMPNTKILSLEAIERILMSLENFSDMASIDQYTETERRPWQEELIIYPEFFDDDDFSQDNFQDNFPPPTDDYRNYQ